MEIRVLKDILSANDHLAEENRRLLDSGSVFAVNLMSSPGAGKTSVILETHKLLKGQVRVGVIEGDVSSSVDAEKIGREGIPVLQINTGGQCHLDAAMLSRAFREMALEDIDLLFIENVGNLICTAEFKLGTHVNVVISSVPEGHDKPLKYPLMFAVADAILINKVDLLPYVEFDIESYSKAIRGMNNRTALFKLSCVTGEGIKEWISWVSPHVKWPGF